MKNLQPTEPRHKHVLILKRLINNKKSYLQNTIPIITNNYDWMVDAVYDKHTKKVIEEVQLKHIHPTNPIPTSHLGWVGPKTWKWLGINTEISHPCQLEYQTDKHSCWKAASTMILSHDNSRIFPKTQKTTFSSQGGINNTIDNHLNFASENNLSFVELNHKPPVNKIIHYLSVAKKPIILIVSSRTMAPNSHWLVCSGAFGDGTNNGTMLDIMDPWPPNEGTESHFFYDEWLNDNLVIGVLYNN